MKKLFLGLFLLPLLSHAQLKVSTTADNKHPFPIVNDNATATLVYDSTDEKLIEIAAILLADDIEKVTGKRPKTDTSDTSLDKNLIIIGSIGHSSFIDGLIASKKIDVSAIEGQWERFLMQTIKNPYPGVSQALVIAGSDKRGAAFGVFTLSEEIGVSPWHFWADVPAKQRDAIHVEKGKYVSTAPSVKYRGIFLNDEAPALRGWAEETFGGFNHKFYEKVFELLLRNKANYLWPAMWQPSAFADDDPENARLADDYGIVMSTSHHEPLMRAHDEWDRFKGGAWNYETNKEKLQEFWRGGIERMGDYESVVTMGMRGDGDEAMSEETAVDLLKTIIEDQRKIIADVTGKPAKETPQVWAIYKEVQDYYDKGLRVDDDILVLYCDDNWGNVRILPKKEDLNHSGGYGMYYHFDFVGGPVSYRWLNVTQLERTWEQMNLSYEWGVRDLWIVNVGDLKPMELPISFFLDFAWNTDAIRAKDLPNYYVDWAKQQFGEEHAAEIAEILSLYTKYNARRTPEMLKPDTYSLFNYREAETIVGDYNKLLEKSKAIYDKLPEEYKSAFYQLVLSPVELCSNLNEMYVAAGKNALYGQQGRASTNSYGDKTKELFFKDEALTNEFHEELEDGKWNHIMAQTHIGYTSWNNPQFNKMPTVSYLQNTPRASLGYVVEQGSISRWSTTGLFSQRFSTFDPVNDQHYYLEIFNQGEEALNYTLKPKDDWVKLSSSSGTVQFEEKVIVSIDWDKAPQESTTSEIKISGAGREFTVKVPIRRNIPEAVGFVENNGVISIDAAHFSEKKDTKDIHWTVVPNLGRTDSSIMVEPANAERQSPKSAPSVTYEFTVFDEAKLAVETYLSPTLNFKKNEGLKYAIAIDDEEPQMVNMHEGETQPDWEYPDWWNDSVTDHIKKKRTEHESVKPGKHTLKIWMIDPGVVFQKFVIDLGGLRPSYLGPPESKMIGGKK